MEWGQKSTSEVRCQPLGFPPDCAHTRLYLCLLLLWFCFFHARDRERERLEYQSSPTQPGLSSATGALVTWNSCVRLLCPALQFPSRNRSAMQPTVQNTQFQHWLSCCVCLPFLKAGVSLPVPSWAPPSSRSHSGGDDEDKGGVSWWCMLYHPASVLFFCLFLTCLILVFLFSDPLSSEYLWPSATPGFRVPKEREECENLAVLQSIVLLYNTVPFSPLSLFSLSLSSSCNPAEIQTVRVWFCLRACFACEVYVD